MTIFKKSIIIILCTTLAFSPLLLCGDFSYAEESDDRYWTWYPVSESAEESAFVSTIFNAYLKSRGYSQYSTPNMDLTEWEYNQLEDFCSSKGITVSELNQYLQYAYDNNNKLHFKILKPALGILNDIYEAILNAYGITPNTYKTIYSGKYYIDNNNNHIMCFVRKSNYPAQFNMLRTDFYNYFIGYGQKAYHSGSSINSNIGGTINYSSLSFQDYNSSPNYNISTVNSPSYGYGNGLFTVINGTTSPVFVEKGFNAGYDCIVYRSDNDKYYIGTFIDYFKYNYSDENQGRYIYINSFAELKKKNDNNGNANITGNQGDSKNPYTDDDKDYVITPPDNPSDDPVVGPSTPTQPPTDPYVPNPTGGGSTDDGNGNTDFHWQMPDINVDWNLGDFSDIFPFSIPFDIIELFDIVDSEPVTPAIYQEVDFGAFNYTIDFDLSYFDEFMEYVRAMELFLYTLTLFIATRGIFKIY